MKLLRTIFYKSEFHQTFRDSDKLYFSLSSDEHISPPVTSVSYFVDEFNNTFYTQFKSVSAISTQLTILEKYKLRRFILVLLKGINQPTLLFATAQVMFGNSLIKEFDTKTLESVKTVFGTSLKVIYNQETVVHILINSIENREKKVTVIAFHQSFLNVLFGTQIRITDLTFLGRELTHKLAKYYLHHKDVSSPELKSKINALERKFKISQM